MKLRRIFAGVFLILLAVFLSLAEVPAVRAGEVNLRSLLESALKNSPQVRSASLGVARATLTREEARSAYFPTLDLSGELVFLDNPPSVVIPGFGGPFPTSDKNLQRYRLEMNYVFFDFGRRKGMMKAAETGIEASSLQEGIVQEEKAFRVAEAVVSYMRARSLLAVARSALEMAREHERVARALYDEGTIPRAELLEARVSVKEAERNLLSAENGLELARINLAIEAKVPVERIDGDVEGLEVVKLEGDYREDLKRALSLRKELKLSDVAEMAASIERKNAITESFPLLFLNSSVSYESNSLNPYRKVLAGVIGFRWNLFSGFRDLQRRRKAALKQVEARLERERLRDLISLQVKDAFLSYREAEKQLAVAESAVETARENLRMREAMFSEGEATSSDVVDAQFFLTRALTERENARYDLILAAYRRLMARGEFLSSVMTLGERK
ncbi:MAG: TolC family protein [Deltaproteobacteria bacterium]|nr:MAG: TolC family protein [Deltaproteobacteria bacterium]